MIIRNIKIVGFGKLKNITHNFTEGINIVYGKNEAGKSTTHSFIKAMLFGIKNVRTRNKLNTLTKYEPWGNDENYEGYLTFSYKSKLYTIHRIFSKDNQLFTISDDSLGLDIKNPDLFLKDALCHLTEVSFNNTISVSQLKNATESSMILELHKYIANLNTSGDMSINTIASIEYLKKQKEFLEAKKIPNATVSYTRNLGQIRKLEKELTSEEYKNEIPDIQQKIENDKSKYKYNLSKISKLQKSIENNKILLKQNGFENKNDIDLLKIETEKIYMEYESLRNIKRKAVRMFLDILLMFLGLFIGIISTIILSIEYPNLAELIGIKNLGERMPNIVELLYDFPIPIAPLIGLFYALALISFISGFIFLISNTQNKSKMQDMSLVLSEVFNHQIGSAIVTEDNMINFKHHIDDMYNILDKITTSEASIKALKKENNEIDTTKDTYIKKIQNQQRLQYEVEQKVSTLNQLKADGDRIKKDIAVNDDIQKEIDSLNLSIDMLQELSSKVKTMFGTYLNETASRYIGGLTNNVYNSLNVDDSLNVTINTKDRIIPLEQLATGAMDQIYFAVRLAVTDLIQGQSENLPLILDDCFAMYDNDRLDNAIKWLSENYQRQMIIFSCHTREYESLEKQKKEFNKIIIQ